MKNYLTTLDPNVKGGAPEYFVFDESDESTMWDALDEAGRAVFRGRQVATWSRTEFRELSQIPLIGETPDDVDLTRLLARYRPN